jgi:hypothetical protein
MVVGGLRADDLISQGALFLMLSHMHRRDQIAGSEPWIG